QQERRAARRAATAARRAAEPPHARRRRLLLRWSWLPAAVLLGLGVHLLVLLPVYAQGRAAWDAGDDDAATTVFERQRSVVPVEQWKADFNAGTAAYRDGWYATAIDALDQALVGVPDEHRCAVQTNRALAHGAMGEEAAAYAEEQLAEAEAVRVAEVARATGEPYDEEVLEPAYEGGDPPTYPEEIRYVQYLFERAADHAALAAEALADPACATPPSGGAGGGGGGGADERAERQEEAEQDLAERSAQAQDAADAAFDAEQSPPRDWRAPGAGSGASGDRGDGEQDGAAGDQGGADGGQSGADGDAGEPGGQPGGQSGGQSGEQDGQQGGEQGGQQTGTGAPVPTPEQAAEAERRERLAERNREAGGAGGGSGSSGGSPGTAPGTGPGPGRGGGAPGGRGW
ncbi:hypothetical protein ACFUMH_12940, partial [Cellulomonas sp. NPDC057328]